MPLKPINNGAIMREGLRLPPPRKLTSLSVEEAILLRRSVREYLREGLSIDEVSMLLWAAQGVTDVFRGFRAAPSAGATYPLNTYLVVGDKCVRELPAGVYAYIPENHSLRTRFEGDVRDELADAALGQPWIREAPVTIAFTAVFERTTGRYGRRGVRYVYIDTGHAAQNVYLMATALGLGTVGVGAFIDEEVSKVLKLSSSESPVYLMPVGKPLRPPGPADFSLVSRYLRR